MTDLNHLLDQIDRLDKEATQAPWTSIGNDFGGKVYEPSGYPLPGCTSCGENEATYERKDAEFIALARTALPQLAQALKSVLHLHRPERDQTGTRDNDLCNACMTFRYPCPTVQAIINAIETTR